LRGTILRKHQVYSMAHLGTRAFTEVGGEVVQSTSFVIRKGIIPDYIATFVRLVEFSNSNEKSNQFYNKKLHYHPTQSRFSDIPGSPIAYWASERTRKIFKKEKSIGDLSEIKKGLDTGNNDAVIRKWYEVNNYKILSNSRSLHEFEENNGVYAPFNKGGDYRKWYGNRENVIGYSKEFRDLM